MQLGPRVAGRFAVAHGVCAGEYDAVLISTDLEPDDAIALQVLAPQLREVPLLVVVGEGEDALAHLYGNSKPPRNMPPGMPALDRALPKP